MKTKKIYSLRELRKEAGLTLTELAELTHTSASTIYNLETGHGKGFSVVLKHRISDYFKVPVQSLFPEIQEEIDLLLGKTRQVQMFVTREEAKKQD